MQFFGLVFNPCILENKEDFTCFSYETDTEVIYAVKGELGKVHPFPENVSATSYYEVDGDGYYFLGYDKLQKLYFLPLN